MAIKLDTLRQFIGGEVQVLCEIHNYMIRGPIKNVYPHASHDSLVIEMEWCAWDVGETVPSGQWAMSTNKFYEISPSLFRVVGTSHKRLVLASGVMHEQTVLFPPSDRPDKPETPKKVVLFMDDERTPPFEAFVARDINSIIALFKRFVRAQVRIDELWLDHDLGTDESGQKVNILPLLDMLEEAAVHDKPYDIGTIYVQSDNGPGRDQIMRSCRRYGYRCRVASFR